MAKKVCVELLGLSGPFTRIARAMSAEWKIRIVPSGTNCSTDGEVIHIPFTADYLPLDKRQILHGLLDHEVCHVTEERRHRDAKRPAPIGVLRAETDNRIRLLLNVVEDVRIEKRYSALYLGVAQNLQASMTKAANDWASRDGHEGWWQRFSAALILQAHGIDTPWADDDFGDYLRACEDELDAMRKGVGEWVDASLALAKRIFAKVKDVHDDAPKPDKARPKAGGGEDDGEDDAPDHDDTTPDEVPDVDDLIEAVRADLESDVIDDAVEHERYIPHPKAQALDQVSESESSLAIYSQAREDVLPQIRVLRQKQRALVSAWTRRRVRSGRDRGDVDDQSLADVRVGASDLFTELSEKRLLDTAITGLVDCSGSMGDNRYPENGSYCAVRTAVALAESWTALGVANEWLGYTVLDETWTTIAPADLRGPYFCRPPLKHIVFKSFAEKQRDARARFGGITGSGSNVDGEAVLWAWQRLIVRRERRKILAVICDGQPATWNGCKDQQEVADERVLHAHLRDAIRHVTSSGVEVIGFGAGTSVPSAFYNKDTGAKFVHISSISTMAMDVFRAMKKRVTDFS
jgi:hypothetical protein